MEMETKEFKSINGDIHHYLKSMSKNKLCVIHCYDSNERKKIHQYLEMTYKVKHVSLYCDRFSADCLTFKKCNQCSKNVLMTYHDGIMENNIDQYYSGDCLTCDNYITWEPYLNDRDYVKTFNKNNIVVIGDYLNVNKPTHAVPGTISDEEFKNIISSKVYIYEIDAPKNIIKIKKLGKYVSSMLS